MLGIAGIIAVLVVLGLSLLITRLATGALVMTGLSEEVARFQARSAFTGIGFTSRETESVVNHPVRRRIIMALMILRSAGVVTIILSLILSFVGPAADVTKLYRLAGLAAGVIVLWLIGRSKAADRAIARLVQWALNRWTDLDVRDYASLLRLSGEYTVMELHVEEDEWLGGKTLRQCNLRDEGMLVLGIRRRDGSYVGTPRGSTEIYPGDTLIVYGRSRGMKELSTRGAGGAGDAAHERAVGEQTSRLTEQARQEHAQKRRRLAEQAAEEASREAEEASRRVEQGPRRTERDSPDEPA